MNALDPIRRLHQHRARVNRQLLDAAGKLTPDQLQKQFAIGQGSIWKSILHLYAAEYVWLDALHGKEQSVAPGDLAGKLPGNQEGDGGIKSLDELKTHSAALDARWEEYLNDLTPDRLVEAVYKVRSTGGRFAFRRSDILLHVCTHAHYTVAQVINMMRHAGVATLPEVMMIALARSEPAAG